MIKLDKFYVNLQQEIASMQLASEEGENQEQIFTRYSIEQLAESGETENYNVAYHECFLGTKKQMKINGYAISDNYETIGLFISVYKNNPEIFTLHKDEVLTAETRITNFFRSAIYNELNQIEASSEIFEFAHDLGTFEELREKLIRVDVFILTNGVYKGEIPSNKDIGGYKLFYRIIDIEELQRLSEDFHSPIEIDLEEIGHKIPCLKIKTDSPVYESYMAVVDGACLYELYERFGARLLEQNVRSFLQFSGKINKGIKETILKSPEMFFAYNNGISATADHVELDPSGTYITKISNFQIVNGGQTTASIYHAYRDVRNKNERPDLSKINVQVKFSVIKVTEQYSNIVSNISKCSNTQNKVNDADFSSNNPALIRLEQLSRLLLSPVTVKNKIRTCWYFERVRGQYKTSKKREGYTTKREKAFLLKNPQNQVYTKESLAKFVNSYEEVYDGSKLVIGPHRVVKGGQSNFTSFINDNLPKADKLDQVYYEDLIAKAILFQTADERYGTKRSKQGAIGDLKNATVPYTISLLNYLLKKRNRELNLYKIWQAQELSEELSDFIYDMMRLVNDRIIDVVKPDTNYTERAKKEEIWLKVREYNGWSFDFQRIENDLINPKRPPLRRSSEIIEEDVSKKNRSKVESIPWSLWHKIAEWGKDSEYLDARRYNNAKEIGNKLKYGSKLSDVEVNRGIEIFDIVVRENYDLLQEIDEIVKRETTVNGVDIEDVEIDLNILCQMVDWERKNHVLEGWMCKVMDDVLMGKKDLTEDYKIKFKMNLRKMMKRGFRPTINFID